MPCLRSNQCRDRPGDNACEVCNLQPDREHADLKDRRGEAFAQSHGEFVAPNRVLCRPSRGPCTTAFMFGGDLVPSKNKNRK